ncbi:hypothetical protein FSP39_012184 [Pinctada imbricata]|uniref:Uncharacterized protein n=1 Tax=Pinctada imbricata TaxID=66713 RepID=A0AA89BWY4_PINIB|nr:hypothetical protein FSP39_012184 [Pinctada imbricata]
MEPLLWLHLGMLLMTTFCSGQDLPPQFTQEGNCDTPVLQDNQKILTCTAFSSPSSTYRWLRNGQFITNASFSGTHTIRDITRNDAGEYRCQAANKLGSILSQACNLVVAYIDPFTTPSPTTIVPVIKGNAATFSLPPIVSVPPPIVEWYKNSVIMAEVGPKHQVTLSNDLIILDADPSETNSRYMATAKNGQSSDSKDTQVYTLQVTDSGDSAPILPTFVVQPEDTTAIRGETSVTLECIANARPLSDMTTSWYRITNGQRSDSLEYSTKYLLNPAYKRHLLIRNPDESDTGVYECEVTFTTAGVTYPPITAQANLTVHVKPTIISGGTLQITKDFSQNVSLECKAVGVPLPTIHWYYNSVNLATLSSSKCPSNILVPPTNQTVVAGSDIQLPCKVVGAPQPTVQWKQDDQVISISGRFQILSENQLYITTSIPGDSGRYTCTATNSMGSQSAEAFLTVYTKTQITRPPQNVTSIKGSTAEMQCGVSSDSNVQVTWMWYRYDSSNGPRQDITSSARHTISAEGTLTISGVYNIDIGRYECFVVSLGGNDSRTAYLQVTELPHKPVVTSTTLGVTDLKSVNVTWSPGFNGNSPIQRFIVQYRKVIYVQDKGIVDSDDWIVKEGQVLPNVRWYVVTGLRPARYFQFRVSAVNSVGEGPASDPKPVPPILMPEQAPSSPPKGFYGSQRSNTSIMLQWQLPPEDSWNGDLLGYMIRYKPAGYPDSTYLSKNTTNYLVTTYELTNLIIFQEYEIQIAAYNNEGVGEFSDSIREWTMEGVPTKPPTEVNATAINSTTVKVVWKPVDGNFLNGVALGYKVTAIKIDPPSSERVEAVPPSPVDPYGQQMVNMHNLLKFTNYTFSVLCYTGKGDGPKSSQVRIQTAEDVPDVVASLAFTEVLDRSIKVVWTPPDSINGILLGYTIQWERTGQSNTQDEVDLTPDYLTYTINQLSPTTSYTVYVFARTVVGPGEKKSASVTSGVPPRLQDHLQTWLYLISRPDLYCCSSFQDMMFQTSQAPPTVPPSQLTVRFINSTALRVSWAPLSVQDWNGAPKGYKIFYRQLNGSQWSLIEVDLSQDSHILSNLEEWMVYEVKMQAYNDVGSSDFSDVQTERTREAAPSKGPDDVTCETDSSTSINCTWGEVPRLDQNGIILGYKVQYTDLSSQGNPPSLLDVPDNTTHAVVIGGLRKFVKYEIQVLAYTRIGDGVLSTPSVQAETFEDVPGPPMYLWFPNVTYTSVRIRWSPPEEPNGVITGYMVSYRIKDTNNVTNSSDLVQSQHELGVFSLQRETYYVFSVRAKTRRGYGEAAEAKVYTMINRRQPDSPTKPQITSEVKARAVTISWQAGFDGYSPLRNYTIEYKGPDGIWTDIGKTVPADVTSYSVTGLHPNTRYSFRVAANNDIGSSPYSLSSDEVTTLQDKPEGAPKNFAVVPKTTDSVLVTWEQPDQSTWNGDILGYLVQYRKQGMIDFRDKSVLFPDHTTVLSSLDKYVEYEVQVLAFNSIGNGPHTVPMSVYVGVAAPSASPTITNASAKNSTALTVSWTPPPEDTQNGKLSGYRVSYRLVGAGVPKTAVVRENSIDINNLEKFSNYSISVLAYNTYGDGPSSPTVYATTDQWTPGPPKELDFNNITMTSLNVSWQPPEKPNGIIVFYDLTYLSHFDQRLVKLSNLSGNQHYYWINKLEENVTYTVTVVARTKVGPGPEVRQDVTTGPQRNLSPGRPTKPAVQLKTMNTLSMSWENGSPGISPILGYYISARSKDIGKWETVLHIHSPETRVQLAWPSLCAAGGCQFSVIAFNSKSISYPSPPSELIDLNSALAALEQANEKPVYNEWWFLVIVALAGALVIMLIIIFLCLVARNKRDLKKTNANSMSTTTLDDGGFTSAEMRHSNRNLARIGNGTLRSIRSRDPPRPSPASVTYSEDVEGAKAPMHSDDEDDDNSSSLSRKPSNLGDDSSEPSDDESELTEKPFPPPPPPLQPPASPPPPPFTPNPYVNDNARRSWRNQNSNSNNNYTYNPTYTDNYNSNYNAYTYTDSENDSSHYALSLNSGQLIMNNAAGSRAPLPGFSSGWSSEDRAVENTPLIYTSLYIPPGWCYIGRTTDIRLTLFRQKEMHVIKIAIQGMRVSPAKRLILGVSGSSLLGTEKCTWGPSYWCSHVQKAKECGAIKHCMDTVWSKQIIKQVNPTVDCTLCQMVVNQTKQLIKNNSTKAVITSFFEKSCNFMPSTALKEMCNVMIKDYEDSLIQLLTSELNAEKICAVMGMCQGFEDTVHTHKPADIAPKTPNGTKICKDCENLFQDLQNMLMDNETRDQIKATVKDLICSQLTQIEGLCDLLVDEYIPMGLDLLAQQVVGILDVKLDPGVICRVIGFCNQSDIYKAMRTRIQLKNVLKKYNKNKLGGEVECGACKSVVTELRNLDRDPSIQGKVTLFLQQKICSKLGSLSAECQQVVKDYSPMLMELLATELDPTTDCVFIGFCQSSVKATDHTVESNQIMTSQIQHHTADSNKLTVVQALPLVPAKKITKNGELCEVCEVLIQQLRDLITQNNTEAMVTSTLLGICTKLPDMYTQQCKDLVQQYVPAILEILKQEMDPKTVCTAMTLCNAKKVSRVGVKSDEECTLCTLAVTELVKELSTKDVQDKIKTVIEQICNELPGNLKNECLSFVEEYSDAVIQLLLQQLDPQTVCKALNLCTNTSSSSMAKPHKPTKVKANVKCVVCEFAMKEIDSILGKNRTKAEIQAALDKVCSLLPSTISSDCTDFVNQYGPTVIALLLQELSPSQVCTTIGLCTSARTSKEDKPVMAMEPVSLMALLDNKKKLKSKGSGECDMCKLLINQVINMLKENKTEAEIKTLLEKMCSYLKSEESMCKSIVETYVDQIIQYILEKKVTADVVCKEIGMCSAMKPTHKPEQVKQKLIKDIAPLSAMPIPGQMPVLMTKDRCLVCEIMMTYVAESFGENKTAEAINKALKEVCGLLGKNLESQCDSIIKKFGPTILKMLQELSQDVNPKAICRKIGLCTTKVHRMRPSQAAGDLKKNTLNQIKKDTVLRFMMHKKIPLLGQKDCTYGPAYWCANMKTAKKCGAKRVHSSANKCDNQTTMWTEVGQSDPLMQICLREGDIMIN